MSKEVVYRAIAPVEQQDPLLDLIEAANYLHVKERWLRRAVIERRIEYVKVGRHLRFRKGALDGYLADQTRRPVEIRTRERRVKAVS